MGNGAAPSTRPGAGMVLAAAALFPGVALLVCAAVGMVAAIAPALAAAAARPPSAPPKSDTELASLRDFLVGADRTFSTRRDAAEVLLDKDTPAAFAVLTDVLAGPVPSEAVLAVLTALAGRSRASAAFVEPLFALLGSEDEPTRRAAAAAFAAFQGSDKVRVRLRDLATGADTAPALRLAAVQALGRLLDKPSLETLVRLTADSRPAVAAAAAQALADATGLKDLGAAPAAWAEWWKKHESDTETVILAGLLRRSREEVRQRDSAVERLQARLIRHLTALYEAADAREKARLALAHMEDPIPQVRALGAEQAAALAREVLGADEVAARQAYAEIIASAVKHINDEDPAARAAAALAVAAWKEAAAVPVLLARLDAEKAPEARAALAAALGGLRAPEAVARLLPMLDSLNEIEVLRAAGALGAIGEKGSPGAAAAEPAARPLGRLARSAPSPAVREAACLALAKIAPPGVEDVLAAALEDATASVRFAATQGVGNLAKVGEKTLAGLTARLQDENKGVRQAAAAALARLGGPDAARTMADRLKPGAETEPAVRNALWTAVKALVDRTPGADLAQDLGDLFFSRDGAEQMQHAAAMYEAALAKFPPSARNSQAVQALYEKLVDAYVAAGMPENAVPALRQLIAVTPAENAARLRELNHQLARILLAKEPYVEAVPHLAAAMKDAPAQERLALAKALLFRAEALVKSGRPEQSLELLAAFAAAQPDWGGTELTDALKQSRDQAQDAAVAQAVAALAGPDDQAAAAAATLKKIGRPALVSLFAALQAAAENKQAQQEARLLAVLESITGRKDHGYNPGAPLEERLKKLAAWRETP